MCGPCSRDLELGKLSLVAQPRKSFNDSLIKHNINVAGKRVDVRSLPQAVILELISSQIVAVLVKFEEGQKLENRSGVGEVERQILFGWRAKMLRAN